MVIFKGAPGKAKRELAAGLLSSDPYRNAQTLNCHTGL